MSITSIQWTDRTWHEKSAARRLGISLHDYRQLCAQGLKHCWQCRLWKPTDAFGVDRSRGDERAARCRSCAKQPAQLRLRIDSPADYERRRYATDADYRFRRRQRVHARKRGVAPMPINGRDALLDKFCGSCAYCQGPAETWDHIVPVSKGGRTEPGNVLPACRSCNSRKKDRDVYDFIDAAGVAVSPALEHELALAAAWGQLE